MGLRRKQRGSAILEFALTGVPLIFMWISIVQMSLGMWRYHTMQYAIKAAGAYVAVHGADCTVGTNSCGIKVKDAAQVFANSAFGMDQSQVNMTFSVLASDHTTVVGTPITCTLGPTGGSTCLSNNTSWPPTGNNSPGQDFEIKADYLWRSALAMVAPGPGAGSVRFGTYHLPGYTHQFILF